MSNQHFDLDALSAYLDGEAGSGERAVIEQHLVTCADCAATTRRLRSASGALSSLGPVQMTIDEHRKLRQAVLGAYSQRNAESPGRVTLEGVSALKRRRGLGRLQWSFAGAFAIIAVAVLGFAVLRPVTAPETGADTVTEILAPTEIAPLSFDSDDQVRRTVLALPEVTGARNLYRVEDAPGSPSTSAFPLQTDSDGARDNSTSQGPPQALSKAAPDSAEDSAAGNTSAESLQAASDFSLPAGEACLAAVAATQTDPLVPLTARRATYKSRPAWLLVYATTSLPTPGKALDEIRTFIVDPAACTSLTGDSLERSVLSSSTLKPS